MYIIPLVLAIINLFANLAMGYAYYSHYPEGPSAGGFSVSFGLLSLVTLIVVSVFCGIAEDLKGRR